MVHPTEQQELRTRAAPARSPCAVKLPTFEGPLDLLLHLIRANEVNIHDIPIALIARQYLEYLDLMRELDIEVAADYLVMAATLAHIKSRLLLPSRPEDEEDEGEDPRAELTRRLEEYACYQEAARELDRRPQLGRDVFEPAPDLPGAGPPEPVLSVSLFAMLEALRRVLRNLPEEERPHEIPLRRITLQERMIAVMDLLREETSAPVLFGDLLTDGEPSRHRVVMTFLAILELARIQAVRIFQNRTRQGRLFGPVRVSLAIEAEAIEAEAGGTLPPEEEAGV